jgi:hypothetical protein
MSMDDRKSFYRKRVSGNGDIEVDYINTNINKMNLRTVSKFRITAAFVDRPDLISQQAYGSYNFGWLISLHNKMMNPFEDYYIGRVIDIPSLDDYYKFYNRNKMNDTPEAFTPVYKEADVIPIDNPWSE